MPREEFELIEDSLEEIVIYNMVVEYQGIVQTDEDIIEIKQKTNERSTSEIIQGNVSQTSMVESNDDVLESTTMSQVVIAHEEEVLTQSFSESSDEELD